MFESNFKVKGVIILLFLLACLYSSFGANITVPSLEIFTKGEIAGGAVTLQTEGEIDFLIEGGYKLGGRISLGFASDNLEQDLIDRLQNNQATNSLTFASASIIVREIFSLPLSFAYFIGKNDTFASGEGFSEIFGTAPVTTKYSGFMYFSEGIRYDGLQRIAGTGINLRMNPIPEIMHLALYLYQDAYFYVPSVTNPGSFDFDPGHFSLDFRTMINLNKIKMEFFLGGTVGGSYPSAGTIGYFRAGLFFHAADVGGEFLAQLGIPRWDPVNDVLNIGLFHLLFEARLKLGVLSIIPTVFLHPGYYLQNETSETGLIDFNLNFRFGDIEKSLVSGGFENNLAFREQNLQGIEIKISPYLSFITAGVLWQFKINVTILPFDITDMFEGFIGINAEF